MKRKAAVHALFACCLFLAMQASAGVITISSRSVITVQRGESELRLSGYYEINNKGDESARETVLHLELNGWSWRSAAMDVAPGAAARWDIAVSAPLTALGCGGDAACAGLDLPAHGSIPMRVLREYQDANGRRFSAPEVILLKVPAPGGRGVAQPAVDVKAAARFEGSGESYSGRISLAAEAAGGRAGGTAPERVRAALSFFSARELGLPPPVLLELAPGETVERHAAIAASSALAGSVYPVFAVVQWEDSGFRRSALAAGALKITPKRRLPYYGAALLMAVVSLAIGVACKLLHASPPSE